MLELNKIYNMDCLDGMKQIDDNSIDLVVTDPPYGLSFMGKDWDKSVPSIDIWKECLRVLKSGAFAFVMCIPRQDCLSRMIVNLGDAGFNMGFTSIYWAYASGFPKASNIGKMVDKKLGQKRKEFDNPLVKKQTGQIAGKGLSGARKTNLKITKGTSLLEGSYAGFQPKPAVEIIIVAMKPLSEKTYVDQAMKNSRGITWLDDCRIPFENDKDKSLSEVGFKHGISSDGSHIGWKRKAHENYNIIPPNNQGRFPANLLVSNDCLNDGTKHGGQGHIPKVGNVGGGECYGYYKKILREEQYLKDSGSFSRYFDLDAWDKRARNAFPFLIVSKASKDEKNKGCEKMPEKIVECLEGNKDGRFNKRIQHQPSTAKNYHPTCKPIQIGSYLIMLGSREDNIILDPFVGSGSFAISARINNRRYIGFEINKDYYNISLKRLLNIPEKLEKWLS